MQRKLIALAAWLAFAVGASCFGQVATIVGIHGRGPVPFDEFKKFVGKG